jgi:hypothetical protein
MGSTKRMGRNIWKSGGGSMSCKQCAHMELRYGRNFCVERSAWMCDRATELAPVCSKYEEVKKCKQN